MYIYGYSCATKKISFMPDTLCSELSAIVQCTESVYVKNLTLQDKAKYSYFVDVQIAL